MNTDSSVSITNRELSNMTKARDEWRLKYDAAEADKNILQKRVQEIESQLLRDTATNKSEIKHLVSKQQDATNAFTNKHNLQMEEKTGIINKMVKERRADQKSVNDVSLSDIRYYALSLG